MTNKCGRAFVNGGFRPVVAKEGPKWTQVVFHDGSHVRVKRIRGRLEYTPLKDYSLQKMARVFLRRNNKLGLKMIVSKGARKILNEVRS